MNMKYKIYVNKHLLVDVLEGTIILPDLDRLFRQEVSDPDFKFVNSVLSDISNAHLNVSIDEVQKFANILVSTDKDIPLRWAILTSEPKQTAMSFLLKQNEIFTNIVGVFTTLEACNQFLEQSIDKQCFYEEDYIVLS